MKSNKNSILLEHLSYNRIEIYPKDRLTDIFLFDEDIKFLRIDVGLSQDASQSAQWILKTNDRGIIGIEPHPININALLNGDCKNKHIEHININNQSVDHFNISKKRLNNRYILMKASIDEEIGIKPFYSTSPDTGNSTFNIDGVEPDRNPNKIDGYFFCIC